VHAVTFLGFLALGVALGAFGTLIGVGGGFLLVPLLAFLYPHEPASVLTAISLATIAANALSGSISYLRMGRTDVRAGIVFAIAGLPGSVVGAMATRWIDRRVFDPLLGAVLLLAAVLVGWRSRRHTGDDAHAPVRPRRLALGAVASVGVGFLSSLLGIGGGVLHVPLLVFLLGFPVHVATATSHLVLAVLALAGTLVHVADGTLRPGLARVVPLVIGVLAGAPVGARLSSRIAASPILRGLAVALALVGVRLLFMH